MESRAATTARFRDAGNTGMRAFPRELFKKGPDQPALKQATKAGGPNRIFMRPRQKLSGDAGRGLHHAAGMDEKAVRRAAFVTVRRAICERFPPGRERAKWLAWANLAVDA